MDREDSLVTDTSTFPLSKYRNLNQVITFPIEKNEAIAEIVCSNVIIKTRNNSVDKQSTSMAQFRRKVDYNWEDKDYKGFLLAVHKTGKYLAYAISGAGTDWVVPLINKETQQRTLLKGIRGSVSDLSFAYIDDEVILAIVDYYGNLIVYSIDGTSLESTLLLHIRREVVSPINSSHRVVWVPYLPEEAEKAANDMSNAKMLALILGCTAELWHIKEVNSVYGKGTFDFDQIESGRWIINVHDEPITDVTFAPDGTAFATVSLDGTFRFFQVYMLDENKRCLRKWSPHDDKPLTSVFFLENYKNLKENFWKFVMTGAKNNTELKLWECTNWSLIQTINFADERADCYLKPVIDPSGKYLILSDRVAKVIYLFVIDVGETEAHVSSISFYNLPFSILSLCISDSLSTLEGINHENGHLSYEENDEDDDLELEDLMISSPSTWLSLWLVHPKSLQNGEVQCLSLQSESSSEYSSFLAKEEPLEPPLPVTLMTPEAFKSPSKKEEEVVGKIEGEIVMHSGGSSPSREVREILSFSEKGDAFYSEKDKENGIGENISKSGNWPDIPLLPESLQPSNKNTTSSKRQSLSKSNTTVEEISNGKNHDLSNVLDILTAQENQMREIKKLLDERSRTDSLLIQQLDNRIQRSLESHLTIKDVQQRDSQEMLLSTLSQLVENMIGSKLRDIVPHEIRKTVLPEITKVMDPFYKDLRTEVTKHLSGTDRLLNDNMTKLVQSKTLTDSIAASFTYQIKRNISETCKELLGNFILPQLEKLLERVFQQIHESFTSGVKECIQQMQKEIDKTLVELRRNADSLKDHSELTKKVSLVLQNELHKNFSSFLESSQSQLTGLIQNEMRASRLSLESGLLTAVRSRTATPAPIQTPLMDVQARIMMLLNAGRLNAAFQEALSASDLNQVVFICQKVPVDSLFQKTPCPLEQSVLLSLIQQLGADMSNHTELKCSYLAEAIYHLELDNAITKEHLPARLSDLQRSLHYYISLHPECKHAKEMTKILRVIKLMFLGRV